MSPGPVVCVANICRGCGMEILGIKIGRRYIVVRTLPVTSFVCNATLHVDEAKPVGIAGNSQLYPDWCFEPIPPLVEKQETTTRVPETVS